MSSPVSQISHSTTTSGLPVEKVLEFVEELFGGELHAKRVLSLSRAVSGVIAAGALGVSVIGKGLAAVQGIDPKHATKQVDRLLSNMAIDVDDLTHQWSGFMVTALEEAWINLDWTEFDADDQSTLVASLQERRGRSTPLMWTTVRKSTIKGKKFQHVVDLLTRLRAAIPTSVRAFIVADREFGNRKMYSILDDLGFGYVIRFRQDILVTDWHGEERKAADWFRGTGRNRSMLGASVTQEKHRVGKVVIGRDKGQKELWCLASSNPDMPPKDARKRYGFRFECEETFRDLKDPRFGMGLRQVRIGQPARRDRILLLGVLAQAILTLLGMAGERCGLDRYLKSNTAKTRQHSLLRQGTTWYSLIPNMREERLEMLMEAFHEVAQEHAVFRMLFGMGK